MIMSCPPVVELCADRAAATPRNPIGTARQGFNQALSAKFLEDSEVAVREDHAVARHAPDSGDFRAVTAFVQDVAAERQDMQRTLLSS